MKCSKFKRHDRHCRQKLREKRLCCTWAVQTFLQEANSLKNSDRRPRQQALWLHASRQTANNSVFIQRSCPEKDGANFKVQDEVKGHFCFTTSSSAFTSSVRARLSSDGACMKFFIKPWNRWHTPSNPHFSYVWQIPVKSEMTCFKNPKAQEKLTCFTNP